MPGGDNLLRVQILGPIRAWQGPLQLDLGPRKQKAVFTVLALRANQPVPVDDVVAAVWGGQPPASAVSLVHTYVARLRRVLEPEKPRRWRTTAISSTSAGYCLRLDPGRVDLLHFRQLASQSGQLLDAGESQRAFDLLGEALRLWPRDAASKFDTLLSIDDELGDLHLEWVAACLQYVTVGLALGQAAAVLPVAEQIAHAEPLNEVAQARYLIVLARTGQRSAAVTWYADLRARLRTELGMDPSPELERAYRIVVGDGTVIDPPALTGASARAPWRGPGLTVGELVGRDDDLQRLRATMTRHRLITLTGPVGSGKTALALKLAAFLRDELPGGVAVVELCDARDESDVVDGLGGVLDRTGCPGSGGGADGARCRGSVTGLPSLLEALGERQVLLILDDADRVIDGCARTVEAIVRSCPYVAVVVTSREALGLPYEAVWPVLPLPVPSSGDAERLDRVLESPAVQLFAQRVALVRPEFRVTAENARTVATICRRLDGLPLALEFAAACLRTHDLDEVASNGADSLRQLNPRRRGQPAHHRSFQQALRWAYECLDPAEQQCLSVLGAVGMEFSIETAAQAYADPAAPVPLDEVRRLLDGLAAKSLLQVRHRRNGTRYLMLESVSVFARHLRSAEVLPSSA
jgi:predicted ATPase/DNA-binding SARP family transcriptional activator